MREIKFRAYDERKEIMHYDFQFIKSGDDGDDWIVFQSDKEKRDDLIPNAITFNKPLFRKQLKIMQYIGLHDSTTWEELTPAQQQRWLNSGKTEADWEGCPIYEEDIVDINYEYPAVLKCSYNYEQARYCFVSLDGKTEISIDEVRSADWIKVRGNTFQNPKPEEL
jgi:hypothetical protein